MGAENYGKYKGRLVEKMAAPDYGPCSSNSNSQLCRQEPSSSGNVIGVDSDQPRDQMSKPFGAVVSLLDRLKSSMEAEISRKRKTKTNLSPAGKRRSQGKSASDPKGIEPSKRVKEFPNEQLKLSGGKLFCSACREELGLKSSTIRNHIHSQKHASGKEKRTLQCLFQRH